MSSAFSRAISPMSATTETSTSVQSSNPRFLWNEIVRWTFEVCILRKEGREAKVAVLLEERLPALIRAWSSRCGLPAAACQERLRGLFGRVQESVELGFMQQRMIVGEICARFAQKPSLASLPGASGPMGLRREVPIDDVSAMLDALGEAEFERMGEAILPVRRATMLPRDLFAEEPATEAVLTA
jgi:hypothetical protein